MTYVFLVYLSLVLTVSIIVLNIVFETIQEAEYEFNLSFVITVVLGVTVSNLFIAIPTMIAISNPSYEYKKHLEEKIIELVKNNA